MKLIGIIAVILCGGLLIYGTADFPENQPADDLAPFLVKVFRLAEGGQDHAVVPYDLMEVDPGSYSL